MSEPHYMILAAIVGLLISGLVGRLIEFASNHPVSFASPNFTPDRPIRSLFVGMFAGPWMLVSDAVFALRDKRIGMTIFASCLASACLWSLAIGIVIVEIAWHLFA